MHSKHTVLKVNVNLEFRGTDGNGLESCRSAYQAVVGWWQASSEGTGPSPSSLLRHWPPRYHPISRPKWYPAGPANPGIMPSVQPCSLMISQQLRLLASLESGHILCLFPEKQTDVVSYFCLVSTIGWTQLANFLF